MVARNWGDGEKKTPCGKKTLPMKMQQNTKRVYPHSSFEITSL
jgi:hypothetical protein